MIQSDLNCFLLLFMTLELVKNGFGGIIFLCSFLLPFFFGHLCSRWNKSFTGEKNETVQTGKKATCFSSLKMDEKKVFGRCKLFLVRIVCQSVCFYTRFSHNRG